MLKTRLFHCILLLALFLSLSLVAPVAAFSVHEIQGFSGRVVLPDQRPVSAAPVLLVCNGAVKQRVLTSAGGEFSIRFSRPRSDRTDEASVFGRERSSRKDEFAFLRWNRCTVRAALPGFESEDLSIHPAFSIAVQDLGTLVVSPREGVRGTTVSLRALEVSSEARRELESIQERMLRPDSDFEMDQKALERLLFEYPGYSEGWYSLGQLHLLREEKVSAEEAFERAIESDPHFVSPYLARAELFLNRGVWEKALPLLQEALRLNPYLLKAEYLAAFAHWQGGEWDRVIECALRVTENSEEAAFPGAHYLLGLAYQRSGRTEQAARELELFLELSPSSPAARQAQDMLSAMR